MKNKRPANHGKMVDSYKSGDFDTCLDLAKKMLQSDPDSMAPLQYAARVHSQRREPQNAKPYWEKLTVTNPDLPEPFLQCARIARLEKKWDVCEWYIDRFICHNPDHAEALGIRIQCCFDRGDAEKAGQDFTRLCRVNPQAVLRLALRAAAHGMGAEVARSICKSADGTDQFPNEMRVRLAEMARDVAIGCEIQKDIFSASNFYQAMQVYTPESLFAITAIKRLRKPILEQARAAYNEKKYADAVKHAKTCIEIAPAGPEPYIIAGRSCAQLGQHQEAFDILGKEIDRFRSNSWLVLNYARAAIKVGKPDIAYAAYSAIKTRDDEKSGAFHPECRKQLDRLLTKAAQDVQALLDNNEMLLACDKLYDFQKAGLDLNDLQMLVSGFILMGEQKLKELTESGDHDALDSAKKLVRLDPDSEYANRVAGKLLMEKQMYAEAHYYWTTLTRLDDRKTEPLLNLARCYLNLNNKPAAVKAASALIALDPHHAEGQGILEQFAKAGNHGREMQR
jgi:tetratricopeptide (TPR) repeat protein